MGSSDCFLKGAISPACPSPTELVQKHVPCPGAQITGAQCWEEHWGHESQLPNSSRICTCDQGVGDGPNHTYLSSKNAPPAQSTVFM